MRSGISIVVTASDRARLEALVAARGSPQKHVRRARIILLTADGIGTVAIMAATGKSKTCVWRWQERFMAEGVDGLLRDKTRPAGKAQLESALVDKVVALTLKPPAQEATHWTVRAMAKAVGIAASSVVKIWHDHGLAPHRWRSFTLSNDRAFAEKLHDVVGLYVSPPAHAIVLSVDEKSQIQALDRSRAAAHRRPDRAGARRQRAGAEAIAARAGRLGGQVGRAGAAAGARHDADRAPQPVRADARSCRRAVRDAHPPRLAPACRIDVNRKALTAAMIDSRDFLAARRRAETEVMLPAGPKIAFTGEPGVTDHRLIWNTLDKVAAKHPGMVLMHGGSSKGAELIASRWADNRKAAQIAFKLDWTRHAKAAPFKRNDAMLDILPIGVIVFAGTGIQDNLADKARKLGIPLFDFRPKPGGG